MSKVKTGIQLFFAWVLCLLGVIGILFTLTSFLTFLTDRAYWDSTVFCLIFTLLCALGAFLLFRGPYKAKKLAQKYAKELQEQQHADEIQLEREKQQMREQELFNAELRKAHLPSQCSSCGASLETANAKRVDGKITIACPYCGKSYS